QQPAGLSAIALKRCRQTRRLRAFMKLAAAALALLTGLLTASAQNAPGKLARTRVFGSDYIRLTDLAEAYRFQMFWTRRNDEVQLASSCSQLEFTVDSHRGGINGVRVYLSAPGASRNGDYFVPLLQRPEIAKKLDADLFVSLHFNAAIAEKDQVKGVEVYCLTPAGASSTNARGDWPDTGAFTGNRVDAKNMLLAYLI